MQTLAVFDFDKTVYKKNSLVDFTIFTIGSPQFALRFLIFLPFYLLFKARLTDDNACKAKFLTIFYKNRTIERLLSDADLYSKQRISHHLDSFHLDRINRHRNAGHKLVVLTATFR